MKNQGLWKRDFTMVVLGQIISLFGNAILRFALPLYLLDQTASPALVGMASACAFLPMIALSPVGGVFADRVNKRNIMVVLDFCTAGLVLGFGLARGHLPLVPLLVVVLMLLYGIAGAYQPAVQASLPLLADEAHLLPANAVINQVSALSGLLGPALGGVLYGRWGIVPILAVSGVCFLCSAVMEIFIRIPHTKRPTDAGALAIVREDLRDSLRFIVRDRPVMLRVVGIVSAFNLFLSSMLLIGLMVIFKQTLGVSDQLYGLSQGALAAGGLCGGVLAGVFAKRLDVMRADRLLAACAVLLAPIGLTLLAGAPAMVSFGIITAASFVMMALATLFTVQMLAFVQLETPALLVGKVISCIIALSMCAQPVGQALYGVLFERLPDAPWAIVFGAAAAALCVALAARRTFRTLAPAAAAGEAAE